MPADSLFPSIVLPSRLLTLTANRLITTADLGSLVVLNGFTLTANLLATGYGMVWVLGAGEIDGEVDMTVAAEKFIGLVFSGSAVAVFASGDAADIPLLANPQTLTETQKSQVQANIGAAPAALLRTADPIGASLATTLTISGALTLEESPLTNPTGFVRNSENYWYEPVEWEVYLDSDQRWKIVIDGDDAWISNPNDELETASWTAQDEYAGTPVVLRSGGMTEGPIAIVNDGSSAPRYFVNVKSQPTFPENWKQLAANEAIEAAVQSSSIEDTLTSSDSTRVLSANQGRILNNNNLGLLNLLRTSGMDYIDETEAAGAIWTDEKITILGTAITEAKSLGIWPLFKQLYFPRWGNEAANVINLINPAANGVFGGTLTHGAGFVTGDGSSSMFSQNGTIAELDWDTAEKVGVAVNLHVADTGTDKAWFRSTGNVSDNRVMSAQLGGRLNFFAGDATVQDPTSNTGSLAGTYSFAKTATSMSIYRNGTLLKNATPAVSANIPVTTEFMQFMRNYGSAYSAASFGAFALFTGATESQSAAISSWLQTLKTNLNS